MNKYLEQEIERVETLFFAIKEINVQINKEEEKLDPEDDLAKKRIEGLSIAKLSLQKILWDPLKACVRHIEEVQKEETDGWLAFYNVREKLRSVRKEYIGSSNTAFVSIIDETLSLFDRELKKYRDKERG